MTSWKDLREQLQNECFRKSVAQVARELPIGRSTIYRLINGETSSPSLAIRDALERLTERSRLMRAWRPRESHLGHPSDT